MQRRRFFPSTPVQQIPGQRVELTVQVRKDAAPAAPEPPPEPPPEPVVQLPVWSGWEDEDGNRAVNLTRDPEFQFDGVGRIFRPALFVAVVDGAQHVHWDVTFTPVLWSMWVGNKGTRHEEERWRGDSIEIALRSEEFERETEEHFIDLPEVDGIGPHDYWPMVTRGWDWYVPNEYAGLPIYIAAGNTLSVSLFDPAAAMSGELTAVAKTIEDVEIGRVTLRLIVDCDF